MTEEEQPQEQPDANLEEVDSDRKVEVEEPGDNPNATTEGGGGNDA